jgi:hypothetical protein
MLLTEITLLATAKSATGIVIATATENADEIHGMLRGHRHRPMAQKQRTPRHGWIA